MSAPEQDPPPQILKPALVDDQDKIHPVKLGPTLKQLLDEARAQGTVEALDLAGHLALVASFAERGEAPAEYVGERPWSLAPEVMAMLGEAMLGRAGWEHAKAVNAKYVEEEVQPRDKRIQRIANERFPDPAVDAGTIADDLRADSNLARLLRRRGKDGTHVPLERESLSKIIRRGRK
jgi:hypothetical protein